MEKDSNLASLDIAGMIISPKGVRAFGSIHCAFILSVLMRRYFECQQTGELTSNGAFTCPKTTLEQLSSLKGRTINRYLHTLQDRGAIVVQNVEPGLPRLFTINEKIIKTIAGCMDSDIDKNKKKGSGINAQRSKNKADR